MSDFSPTGLRVLREIAEVGSFTAAAQRLGYTQSAVSRQVAALEAVAGQPLFHRRRDGVRLTHAGGRLVARATRVLAELDAARRELAGAVAGPVRLGAFATAAAGVVPDALATVAAEHPDLVVTLREAGTPGLVRALRAGTLDLAVVAQAPPFRPLDTDAPAFRLTTLSESELMIGVGPGHPLAGRDAVELEELADQVWVTSRTDGDETLLGVWPGLPGRADVRYVVRDWLAKVRIVAAGLAVTTVPPTVARLPAEIRLVGVRGEPQEQRRVLLARLPTSEGAGIDAVADAFEQVFAQSTTG